MLSQFLTRRNDVVTPTPSFSSTTNIPRHFNVIFNVIFVLQLSTHRRHQDNMPKYLTNHMTDEEGGAWKGKCLGFPDWNGDW
jgi:hypothetical protein